LSAILLYSKNSFLGKANTKIARDFEPLFGEPRPARRATKSMGGALRRPKNGFQKIRTSGFGGRIKPFQTFSIILPNLIHKSRKKNLKK